MFSFGDNGPYTELEDEDMQGELLHQPVYSYPDTGRQRLPSLRYEQEVGEVLQAAFDKYAPFYDTSGWE